MVLAHGAPARLRLPANRLVLPHRIRHCALAPVLASRNVSLARPSRRMIPAVVVFAYLAVVLYIGIFAFRKSGRASNAEDYFLAGRSLGPAVFLLSLFGANMT